MCRSTNRHRVAHPEDWFRILHVAPVAPYREQTVEIALAPKGAFGNGNVGALTHWVAADHIVNGVPADRGTPNPPREPKTPRVVKLLRKALEWQDLLKSGAARNQTAIARREGITRARVTQVMGMLRLAPEIQQLILSVPSTIHRPVITERALRPIVRLDNLIDQKAKFHNLIPDVE